MADSSSSYTRIFGTRSGNFGTRPEILALDQEMLALDQEILALDQEIQGKNMNKLTKYTLVRGQEN